MSGQKIPTNHRLAERKLITFVNSGEWEIDSEGRIWRLIHRSGRKDGGVSKIPVKRRRAEKQIPSGYLIVRATVDGKRVVGMAHRLVWQHYYGDIPEGLVINHKNGVKNDNRPDNMEVVSYSENASHAHRTGLKDQRGEKNPASKISNQDVAKIRLEYSCGDVTLHDLAVQYGVSFKTISKIVRGERRQSQLGPVGDYAFRRSSFARGE